MSMMEVEPQVRPLPVPESRWERFLYALILIVLPVVCFSLSNILKPEWQSGKFSDYVVLMLIPDSTKFFYPFLLYAMLCIALLLIAPERFAPRFLVRFGVYTGVLLALQYSILVAGTDYLIVSIFSAGFLILGQWVSSKIKSKKVRSGFLLLYITVSIGLVFAFGFHIGFAGIPFLICIAILAASPLLCFALAAVTAIKLIKLYETKTFKLWQATTLFAWLAVYITAWRFSVLQAIDVYHSLPTSRPDCYIATASARGHRRIVHSRMLVTANGVMWTTTQLQVFKCGELALMALAPRTHYVLRAVYDVAGYTLAKRLTNPFLADLAYLLLKPFEWATILVLKAIVPEIDAYVGHLYSEK